MCQSCHACASTERETQDFISTKLQSDRFQKRPSLSTRPPGPVVRQPSRLIVAT